MCKILAGSAAPVVAGWILAFFAVDALAAESRTASAAPAASAAPGAADLAAIRAAVDSYVAAYNRGDAKAVADHWSETGQWISPSGERIQGRAAIAEEMRVIFEQGNAPQIEVIDPAMRLVSADVAVEEGTARVTYPGGVPSTSNYIAIHVKRNGQWKLDSIRESEAPEGPSAEDNLKQLEWMVGEWVDESPNVVVEQSCRWSEDRHFLLGEFTVQVGSRPAMRGTVRIGWDPLRQQIRSWIFDSEGGFSEGMWTRLEDRWVVKMTGVRADGATASSTNTYTPLREDAFLYTTADRIVGDEVQPDQAITVVRKPPQPVSQ